MRLFSDLPVLWKMIFPAARGTTHQERLEGFYGSQADSYDAFRRKILHGREELLSRLEFPAGGTWIDLGAGTGHNAEILGDRLRCLDRVIQVDLCPSLHAVARRRIHDHGWPNVEAVLADATKWKSPVPADVVTFSYSLTMIPDWFSAIDRARESLKPGGQIGVVDFYVSRKHPEPGLRRHPPIERIGWPLSYGWDNVFLSPDHLPYLRAHFMQRFLAERKGSVPYSLGLRSPHYLFVGTPKSNSP